MPIMSHESWLRRTDAGFAARRGTHLRAVDAALQQYHQRPDQGSLNTLRSTLKAWTTASTRHRMLSRTESSDDWLDDRRNKDHAVDDLYVQVGLGALSESDRIQVDAGLAELESDRKGLLRVLFEGAQLEWRSGVAGKILGLKMDVGVGGVFAANNLKATITRAPNVAPVPSGPAGRQIADSIFGDLVPPQLKSEVAAALQLIIPGFMEKFGAACVPLVGAGVTGVLALKSFVAGVSRQREVWASEALRASGQIADGDPVAAFVALEVALTRDRNKNYFEAATGAAECGAKIAGTLIDGGVASNAAVGLASSIMQLTNVIRIVVRDVSEKNRANELLASGDFDIGVCRAHPILGAYLICCAPHGALLNLTNLAWPHRWVRDLQRASENVAPLREVARALIDDSRFVIPQLAHHAGLLKRRKDLIKAAIASREQRSVALLTAKELEVDGPEFREAWKTDDELQGGILTIPALETGAPPPNRYLVAWEARRRARGQIP